MLFKVVIKFLLALSFVLGSHKLWAVNSKYASNSVLATGTWKKEIGRASCRERV